MGLTGNEEKGPETVPRLGGRPRVFPLLPLLLGQAEETAGPWRRLGRVFSPEDSEMVERGSAGWMKTSDGCWLRGAMVE